MAPVSRSPLSSWRYDPTLLYWMPTTSWPVRILSSTWNWWKSRALPGLLCHRLLRVLRIILSSGLKIAVTGWITCPGAVFSFKSPGQDQHRYKKNSCRQDRSFEAEVTAGKEEIAFGFGLQ